MSNHTDEQWWGGQLSPDLTPGPGTFNRTMLRLQPLRPSRVQAVDAGFALLLGGLAMWGLHATFTGSGYFVVGVFGTCLGIALAHIAHALRAPVVVLLALTLAVFFVLGSVVALRSAPLPHSLADVAEQSVHGWKDLLTTLPPVDGDGPLLVLPYLLGLVAGAVSQTAAERTRLPWPPAAALISLLGIVILLGVPEPSSLVLQGGLFGVLAICWIAHRGRRLVDPISNGSGAAVRWGLGALVVAAAGLVAVPFGTTALASDGPRIVLRDHVVPPFDVGVYPSPLAGFRRFAEPNSERQKAGSVFDKLLFTVDGAPAGTSVRIATLDSYDGTVWGAANNGGSPGQVNDTFQRVSSTIRNPLSALGGTSVTATVTLGEGWSGVWVPTIGALEGVTFLDDPSDHQAGTFRYNLATSTGVVPDGLQPGQSIELKGLVTDQSLDAGMGASSDVTVSSSLLEGQASAWSEGSNEPLERVLAAAAYLRENGTFTHGKNPFQRYSAGHYEGRLDQFVNGDQIAGDDEQYAATMALLANSLGVPARVVLGVPQLPKSGSVRGKDVHAWVELRVADGSWRTLATDAFMDDQQEPDKNPPQPDVSYSSSVVPPPAPVPPPSTVGDPADGELNQVARRKDDGGDAVDPSASGPSWLGAAVRWVGPPIGLVGVVVGLILGLKARRRRRRRTDPVVTRRFSGGWAHVMDRARDLRLDVPGREATRAEQAAVLAAAGASRVALVADDCVFGPDEPTPELAEEYWTTVDRLCKDLGTGVGLPRRIRAAISVASFRSPRLEGPA